MKDFDLKSAFITFLVTFLTCLVIHSVRTDHLDEAVYNLILDNKMKNEQLQQAAQEINKLNNYIVANRNINKANEISNN